MKTMLHQTRPPKFSNLTRPASLQRLGLFLTAAALATTPLTIQAAILADSDEGAYESLSASGNFCLAGRPSRLDGGAAFLYRNLDTATGVVREDAKLMFSPPIANGNGNLGDATSVSGNIGLVGQSQGSAFIFRNLDTVTGSVLPDAQLSPSEHGSTFGDAVSLSGTIGLIGSRRDIVRGTAQQGSAYLYRNLDTVTGSVTESARLISSDGGQQSYFGSAVSLSGTMGLVGAYNAGAAYVFRNLDTATGTIIQNAKLLASDGDPSDGFGITASLSGSSALVGAPYADIGVSEGIIYLFRNLDTATGNVTENARLISSENTDFRGFPNSVSLSGDIGLAGNESGNADTGRGSALLFRNLQSATGVVTENVRLYATQGYRGDGFGRRVAVDGDQFVVSNFSSNPAGKAFSGSVGSLTTLDAGNTSKVIFGITFISQEDWIIGQSTNGNQVTLSAGDQAKVVASGKAVYIGKNAPAGHNKLIIAGSLQCTYAYIGSTAGNANNVLQVESTGKVTATALRLANGNRLLVQGTPDAAKTFLQTAPLQVFTAGAWKTVTSANYQRLISVSQSGGYTVIVPL